MTGISKSAPRKPADDGIEQQQTDTINPQALKEASRLGTSDAYLVEADLQESDEREGTDQPDGRPNSLANGDNPER